MDDEIFDEDEALDYIVYKELEESKPDIKNSKGCLGSALLFLCLGATLGIKILI